MKCDFIFVNDKKDTAYSKDTIAYNRKVEIYSTSQYMKTYKGSDSFQLLATNLIALISCKTSYRLKFFTENFKLEGPYGLQKQACPF